MKKIFITSVAFVGLMLSFATNVQADGCYICSGGTYVKYTGSDDQDKRKAAKACGCQVSGTRGDCSAANLKVLCTVQNEIDESLKLACKDKNNSEEDDQKGENAN